MVNIFLGSSIISQWNVSSFFLNFQNINLGISKMTTNKLIPTYSILLSNDEYKNANNIILYIGSNDIARNATESQIVNNIVEFLHFLQNTYENKNIIFIAILKSPKRTPNQIKKIDCVNRKIREFADSSKKFTFCNANRQLVSHNNYKSDQTHLSSQGYSTLTRVIEGFFN